MIKRVEELDSNRKTLFITVGLPYSGKSTWAREQNFPIVNPDSIRVALHGQRFYSDAEPFVWAIAKTMVRSLFLAGNNKIILDACNISYERQLEWISELEWKTKAVLFADSKDMCIKRALLNSDNDIVPIIERMAKHHPLENNFCNTETNKLYVDDGVYLDYIVPCELS